MVNNNRVNIRRNDLYKKLHKFSLFTIFGITAGSVALFCYNIYLFKTRMFRNFSS